MNMGNRIISIATPWFRPDPVVRWQLHYARQGKARLMMTAAGCRIALCNSVVLEHALRQYFASAFKSHSALEHDR